MVGVSIEMAHQQHAFQYQMNRTSHVTSWRWWLSCLAALTWTESSALSFIRVSLSLASCTADPACLSTSRRSFTTSSARPFFSLITPFSWSNMSLRSRDSWRRSTSKRPLDCSVSSRFCSRPNISSQPWNGCSHLFQLHCNPKLQKNWI